MKLATFSHSNSTRIGIVDGDGVVDLASAAPDLPREMLAFLDAGPAAVATDAQKAVDFVLIEDPGRVDLVAAGVLVLVVTAFGRRVPIGRHDALAAAVPAFHVFGFFSHYSEFVSVKNCCRESPPGIAADWRRFGGQLALVGLAMIFARTVAMLANRLLDREIDALDTITLGLLPKKELRVRTTAAALLVDTRTGYLYAIAEGTSKRQTHTSFWTSAKKVDEVRRKTECEAFQRLIDEVEGVWSGVLRTYDT